MPWMTPLVLSFVAGYVDTTSFIHFSGLLAAHITGNLVLFAVALSQDFTPLDSLKLLSLPVFVGAVMSVTWLHDRVLPASWGIRRSACLLATVSLGLITIGTISASFQHEHTTFRHMSLGLMLIFTMGIQNTTHRLYPGFGPMSTVMTGNVTQLVVNTTRKLVGQPAPAATPVPWTSLSEVLWLVGSFMAGCLLAIPMTNHFNSAALLVPGAILGARLLLSPRLARGELP
jgi:uncharacterized membrane protein YoaK (UPF0700 family)